MKVVYSDDMIPTENKKSIFLVGPTPRTPLVQGWRPKALDILEHLRYDGIVYYPEPRLMNWPDLMNQVEWELEGLEKSNLIVCWMPRKMENMPALTSNIEFGCWVKSGKLFYGRPDNADNIRYLDYVYKKWTGREPHTSLNSLLRDIIKQLSGEN